MLKRWCHLFNPVKEVLHIRHIWVHILDCPLFLWNREAFTAIGNHLGRFLHVESSLSGGLDRRIGKIYVEIDITQDLVAELSIEWRGTVSVIELDYWGLPFRRSTCNKVGHLKAHCSGRPIKQLNFLGLLSNPSSIEGFPEMNEPNVEALAMDLTTLSIPDISLIGKLQLYSPSLVASLTLEEFFKLKVSLLNDRYILQSGLYKEGLASLKDTPRVVEGEDPLTTNPSTSLVN